MQGADRSTGAKLYPTQHVDHPHDHVASAQSPGIREVSRRTVTDLGAVAFGRRPPGAQWEFGHAGHVLLTRGGFLALLPCGPVT
jgi:hypothetical protein